MTVNASIRAVLSACLLGAAATSHAQTASAPDATVKSIYSCTDARGRTLTSDRPIPECATLPMRELRTDGALRRQIDPPLNRAQREARARAEIEARARAMIERQEAARDRALLMAYPTMVALEDTRDRQIAEVQAQIDLAYERMVKLHEQLQAVQARVRTFASGQAPESLQLQVTRLAGNILSEDALVKARLNEQEQIRQRFGDDAARLKVLLERQEVADRMANG